MIAAACVAAPRVSMIWLYVRSGRPWARVSIVEYTEMWRALSEHAFVEGWGGTPYPGEDWVALPWRDPVTGQYNVVFRKVDTTSRFLPTVHKPKRKVAVKVE